MPRRQRARLSIAPAPAYLKVVLCAQPRLRLRPPVLAPPVWVSGPALVSALPGQALRPVSALLASVLPG